MAAKLDDDTDIVTAGLTHTISRNEVIDFRVAGKQSADLDPEIWQRLDKREVEFIVMERHVLG